MHHERVLVDRSQLSQRQLQRLPKAARSNDAMGVNAYPAW
jgi:hypothetical protein